MQGAVVQISHRGARVLPGAGLPLEALMLGRPVEEVARLLPRLFNLCRHAQAAAARLALGLPPEEGPEDLAAEVLRDHGARILVSLRRSFDLSPLPRDGTAPLALSPDLLFGPAGRLPDSLAALADWQAGDLPAAALAREITSLFPAHCATTAVLPPPGEDPWRPGPCENSPAGRQQHHPLMRAVEATRGRGPLWRFLGLLADAEAVLQGRLAPPCRMGATAVVQAARGAYALRLSQAGGILTGLARRTPTDAMLERGGALEQALSLVHPSLAPQVLALHDPCLPVTLQEVQDA